MVRVVTVEKSLTIFQQIIYFKPPPRRYNFHERLSVTLQNFCLFVSLFVSLQHNSKSTARMVNEKF